MNHACPRLGVAHERDESRHYMEGMNEICTGEIHSIKS